MKRRSTPSIPGTRPGSDARRDGRSADVPRWRFSELAGRLVELSAPPGPTAALTLALALARDAQRQGETVAWVGPDTSLFFPPDAARAGLDLAALPIVRTPDVRDVARSAERLVRSGAFGLVLLDLTTAGARVRVAPALLNRLAALARKHEAAVVCLTEKPDEASSLGPLVSLRACARRAPTARSPASEAGALLHGIPLHEANTCLAVVEVLRDRRRPGRWTDTLPCTAPAGVEALLPRPSLQDRM